MNRHERREGEHARQEISVGGRDRKAGRERGADHGRHEKDHPHVAQGVEHEQRLERGVERPRSQPGRHVPPGDETVHEEAEQAWSPKICWGFMVPSVSEAGHRGRARRPGGPPQY